MKTGHATSLLLSGTMRGFDLIFFWVFLFIFILLPSCPASMLTPTLNRLSLNKINSAVITSNHLCYYWNIFVES